MYRNVSDTISDFGSFAQTFLSSTQMSEEGLSENDKRERTDPQLLKSIPSPDLSSVLFFWGEGARDQLAEVLNEYDDLFMKHKTDIGRCTIAKHRIEQEPEAIHHREGARRMSPDKAAKANQGVRNLLALGLIQPSYSPWASGIVMEKKKTGELRFCCDFRPLNDVTVKDAFLLPRIDENLSRIGNAKIFTSNDLAWAFWQIPLKIAIEVKLHSPANWACLNGDVCPLGCAMHPPHSNDQSREPYKKFNKDTEVSSWPTSTT